LINKLKKDKVRNVTFTLDGSTIDKLQKLSNVTGLSKSAVVRNLVEMFGDIYSDVIDLIEKYDGDVNRLTLDDYLRENGYGFLIDGRCK
jgi:predicted DNA-binding protein